MSIYRPSDVGLFNVDPPKPRTGAASAEAPAPKAPLSDPAMVRRRKLQPCNEPLRRTFRWIATLPKSVRPLALLRQYPRIANAMALMWREPDIFRAYLEDLLIDRRGNRQGFPKAIRQELLALRALRKPDAPAFEGYGRVGKRA
jgi:hypothetical protein